MFPLWLSSGSFIDCEGRLAAQKSNCRSDLCCHWGKQGPADSPRKEKVALDTSRGIMQNSFNFLLLMLKMDLDAKFSVIKKEKICKYVQNGITWHQSLQDEEWRHSALYVSGQSLQSSVTLSTKDSLHWRMLKDAQGAGLFWCAKIWHIAVSSKTSIDISPGTVDITCNVATELTVSLSIDCHTTPMLVDPDKDF